jgi:hypothetical protein
VPEAIVFLRLPARRALQAIHRSYPDIHLEIERRGPIRRPVRAILHVESPVLIEVLTDGELSAELRARRDASLDPLSAVRVREDWAERIAEATGGTARVARPDPVLRGLALCALVGRLQTEEDEWEGREQEPQRLLSWLESHGADAALSEVERAWILAPVDALPYAAWSVGLPEALRSHGRALGIDEPDIPALMNALGYLADELPKVRMRPGAERYLR